MSATERWASCAEVAKAMGEDPGNIYRKAKRGEWTWRLKSERGPNGLCPREYLVSSLPHEAQVKLAAETSTSIVPAGAAPLPLFAEIEGERVRCAVPENLEAEVRAHHDTIRPLLAFEASGRAPITLPDGKEISTLNELAAWTGAQHRSGPKSARTVRRWLKRFKKSGDSGLAKSVRKDEGKSRFFTDHPAAHAYIEKKFLVERIENASLIWEALRRDWSNIEGKGKAPSYSTVQRHLDSIPKPVQTLALQGPRALWSKCSPYIIRGPVPAMAWWVVDHRELDVDCANTLFAELKAGEMYRPWITAIGDWGSRAWVGFAFSPSPNWRTIASAIRTGLRQYGFPQNYYWDNGKDFKKVQRMLEGEKRGDEFGEKLAEFLHANGVQFGITRAQPYNSRAKPIESWFAGLSKRFDLRWGAAYQGRSTAHRSEYNDAAQKRHARYLDGKAPSSPLPSDAEVVAGHIQLLEEENNRSRRVLGGRTPLQMLEQHHPTAARQIPNARLLDVLFCERDSRIVQAGGCVQLDRMRYEPTEASLRRLAPLQGRKIIVLRDPYNLGEAVALKPETLEFLGDLRIQEFIAQCPNGRITRDQIQAAMRRQRSLKRDYSNYLAVLSALAQHHGWPSERELLLERAGVSTGTDGRRILALAPGAQRALPAARRELPSSPFVDDAAAKVVAKWGEGDD